MPALPRRDTLTIVGALSGVVILCWYYLISMASDMQAMMAMPGMPMPVWDGHYFLLMLLMWAVMMTGMMLPSVIPTLLIYAGIVRKAKNEGASIAPTALFACGYLLMWLLFSIAATGLQWLLNEFGQLSLMMRSNNLLLGSGLLLFAGLYQFLPLKDACLQHCRSPVKFISENWRTGGGGAVLMGLHHGLYCVGCCWVLMGLLFVGGVMSLLWIAALTLFVLLEKLLPFGALGGRIMGALMLFAGSAMLLMP